jgi:hypothetical protein
VRPLTILPASLLLAVPIVTFAQAPEPSLREAIDALYRARESRDGEAWGRHVAPDYLVTHPDGRVHNRSEEMAEISASGQGQRPVIEDERFRTYGNVVIYTVMRNRATRATDVWVKINGEWKIVSAQGSTIAVRQPR